MFVLVLLFILGVNLDNGDEYFDSLKLVIINLYVGLGVNNIILVSVEIIFNVCYFLKIIKESLKEYLEKVLKDLFYILELELSSLFFIMVFYLKFISVLKENILKICYIIFFLNIKGGMSDA